MIPVKWVTEKTHTSSIPIFGTMFLRDGTSRVVGDFYGGLKELEKKKGSGTASLAEIGELAAGNKLKRQLSEKWDENREVKSLKDSEASPRAKEIIAEVTATVKAHNKQNFKKLGAATVLYAATAPSAETSDKEEIKAAMEEYSFDELSSILRAEIKKRGGSTRIRTSTGKLTAYGGRLSRLKELAE